MINTKNTGTDMFQKQIKQYLDKRASEDALFAASYNKKHKNIEDCVAYIIGEVQKAGKSAWADEEIYGMAVHYYDEDNLQAKPYKGNVQIVSTQLADDVKAQLNREAEEMYREELLREMRQPKPKAKAQPKPENKVAFVEQTLF